MDRTFNSRGRGLSAATHTPVAGRTPADIGVLFDRTDFGWVLSLGNRRRAGWVMWSRCVDPLCVGNLAPSWLHTTATAITSGARIATEIGGQLRHRRRPER